MHSCIPFCLLNLSLTSETYKTHISLHHQLILITQLAVSTTSIIALSSSVTVPATAAVAPAVFCQVINSLLNLITDYLLANYNTITTVRKQQYK